MTIQLIWALCLQRWKPLMIYAILLVPEKDINSRWSGVSEQTEQRFPEGTAALSQLGKHEPEGAWRDTGGAAGCASVCSSWGVPSQLSPSAVQHHTRLLTQTRLYARNNKPSEQSAAARATRADFFAADFIFLHFVLHWLILPESEYTWGRRRNNAHCSACVYFYQKLVEPEILAKYLRRSETILTPCYWASWGNFQMNPPFIINQRISAVPELW